MHDQKPEKVFLADHSTKLIFDFVITDVTVVVVLVVCMYVCVTQQRTEYINTTTALRTEDAVKPNICL